MRPSPLWAICAVMAVAAPACSSTNTVSEPATAITNPVTTTVTPTTVAASTSLLPATSLPSTTSSVALLGDPAACPVGALDTATGPVTIDFWFQATGNRGEALKTLITEFNASQNKVVVTADFQGDQLFDKYTQSIGTGSGPDVVADTGGHTQAWLDSASTVPVGSCVESHHDDVSDMYPAVKAVGMDGGTLAAMPFALSGFALYYNKAAFKKAGLDPEHPPTTIEEIRAASTKLVAAQATKHGLAMLARGAEISGVFAQSGEPWAVSASGTGRADRSNGGGEFGTRLVTELADMEATGELLAFAGNDPSPDNLLALASGDAAMAIAPAGSLGDVLAAIESGVGNTVELGLAPMPSFGDQRSVNVEGGGTPLWIPKGTDDAKREAAYAFISWLVQPEQVAEFVISTGAVAIREKATKVPALVDYWTANPLFEVATAQVVDPTRALVSGYGRIGTPKVADAFDTAITAILTDHADPVAALAEATKAADAAIADYNARTPAGG